MKLTKLLLSTFTALAFMSCCESAKSATLIYNLNSVQTGATPSGIAPWAVLTFTDVDEDTVLLSVLSNLQSSTEFTSEVNFNVDPSLNLSNLTVATANGGSGTFLYNAAISPNGIGGGGAGSFYDVGINFSTSNSNSGIERFNGSDHALIYLNYSGPGTFNANSFNFGDSKNGEFATAHVQGINTELSSWTTQVPEPSAAILGGLGALALLRRKRY